MTSLRKNSSNLLQQSLCKSVRGVKPLTWCGTRLVCSKLNQILVTDDLGRSFQKIGEIPLTGWKNRLSRHSRLVQRILRTGIYRCCFTHSGNLVLVYRGGIYLLTLNDPMAAKVFSVTRGSRPTSLANDPDGLCVFGEYWNNADRVPVHICGSADQGQTWDVVYTFPEKSIRHVHGISFDPFDKCFWICTGDWDHETFLYRADPAFRHLEPVVQGGQQSRYFYTIPTAHCVYTATDTPSEQNWICRLDKRSGVVTQLCAIENSNFFSCLAGSRLFFSTVAEPSPVNDQRQAHVWTADLRDDSQWERIASCPTDWLDRVSYLPGVPSGLFQYPTIGFPEGLGPEGFLVSYATGLSGWHDEMRIFDMAGLSANVAETSGRFRKAA